MFHSITLIQNQTLLRDRLGVRPTLPVEDIVLLFGIDLVGDKVIMDPIISEEPSYEEK